MDALRLRLEEKETTLNKKSKQIQEMSEEKSTLNGEIHDLKDMLDVKERKVNVLQKKVRTEFHQIHTFINGSFHYRKPLKTMNKMFIVLLIHTSETSHQFTILKKYIVMH